MHRVPVNLHRGLEESLHVRFREVLGQNRLGGLCQVPDDQVTETGIILVHYIVQCDLVSGPDLTLPCLHGANLQHFLESVQRTGQGVRCSEIKIHVKICQ